MRRSVLDLAVGVFVLLGILALGWLSIRLGKVDFVGGKNYTVTADFPSAGGVKNGSSIEIAGVAIGRVSTVQLANYQARAVFSIPGDLKLTEGSISPIQNPGLTGAKVWKLMPAGA